MLRILKNLQVPTGNILVVEGSKGKLECLSLGDYGQEKNVKADFLGLSTEINGVPHGELLPLETKWVATISSQYGCSMGCQFCDVPKVGPGRNASLMDMIGQVQTILSLHKEVLDCKRLNIHFARMGEPTFNRDVIKAAHMLHKMLRKNYTELTNPSQQPVNVIDVLKQAVGNFDETDKKVDVDLSENQKQVRERSYKIHPVVSTMMPKYNEDLTEFLVDWMNLKNSIMYGEAGLQLSINTTDDDIRFHQFNGNSWSLPEISSIMNYVLKETDGVVGRKIALNFALTDAPIDADYLATLFDPDKFMCKITPMHMTNACKKSNIVTKDGYSDYYAYKQSEESLKAAGFDVLVFVPSMEEDQGRITCGNAILSGSLPTCEYKEIKEEE